MQYLADILLVLGTGAVCYYCNVLVSIQSESRKAIDAMTKKLGDLEARVANLENPDDELGTGRLQRPCGRTILSKGDEGVEKKITAQIGIQNESPDSFPIEASPDELQLPQASFYRPRITIK